MKNVGVLRIAAGAGMLLLGVGQEVIDPSAAQIDGKVTVIQVRMSDAVRPDHGSDREAAGQRFELTRATQVATPSAMIWYGAPENPKGI